MRQALYVCALMFLTVQWEFLGHNYSFFLYHNSNSCSAGIDNVNSDIDWQDCTIHLGICLLGDCATGTTMSHFCIF